MRRLFWLALGATAGVLVFRKLSRAAERMTPQGIAASVGAGLSDLADALRDFAADVREAMSSQEAALRAAAGLDAGGENVLSPGPGAPSGAVVPGPAGDVAAAVSPTADQPAAGGA